MDERQEEREKGVGELEERTEEGIEETKEAAPRAVRQGEWTFPQEQRKEALWAEISAELKLQPFDVRRWFESQRTHYGKLSKLQTDKP